MEVATLSMFSSIDAEINRGIVKKVLDKKREALKDSYTKDEVIALLAEIQKECEQQMQE